MLIAGRGTAESEQYGGYGERGGVTGGEGGHADSMLSSSVSRKRPSKDSLAEIKRLFMCSLEDIFTLAENFIMHLPVKCAAIAKDTIIQGHIVKYGYWASTGEELNL